MNKKIISWIIFICAFAGIGLLIFVGAKYIWWMGLSDHGEVNMSAVSYLLVKGEPLYTSLDANEYYSLEHGPIIYLVTAAFMKIFGANILVAKIPGYIALLLAMITSAVYFMRAVSKKYACCLIGIESWILLKWPFIFMNRDDSFMLLCVMAGFLFVRGKRYADLVFVGFFLGILINLKIHGAVYFFPILVLAYQYNGWKKCMIILGISAVIAILPFLLPAISLIHYLDWLGQAIGHGISMKLFLENISYIGLFSALIIASGLLCGINWNIFYREYKWNIFVSVFSAIVISFIGAKLGSGNYHLIPIVPTLLYFLVQIVNRRVSFDLKKRNTIKGVVLSILILLVIFGSAINSEKHLLAKLEKDTYSIAAMDEIRYIQTVYNGQAIEVGYGEDKDYSYFRQFIPLFVFDNNPYCIDAATLMDMKLAGIPMSPMAIENLVNGNIGVWLIPHGSEPFALHSYYDGTQKIFEKNFRDKFQEHYRLVEQLHYFDVWIYIM